MNRIIAFLPSQCRCHEVRERLDELLVECHAIEAATDGAIEFIIPSPGAYRDGKRDVQLMVTAEADDSPIDADLRTYAIQQMRAIARELLAGAERLERGGE